MTAPGSVIHRSAAVPVVVAGQQPAAGGGPLYTLVKAAQAVAWAQRLSAQGTPCRALFWIASEDHDVGEANHIDILDRRGDLHRCSWDLGPGRASLRFRPALRAWRDAEGRDLPQLLQTHCGPGLGAEFVRSLAPHPEESLGAWQGRWLQACLPDLDIIEPHALRVASAPVLRHIVASWPALRPQLLAAGWAASFSDAEHPPLFHDHATGRRPLTATEALDLLARQPEDVSTGAGLRPLAQQATLPVVAAIVGPGEWTYHQVLGPLFASTGIPAPPLVRRVQTTLAPAWYLRACHAWGVDPATGAGPAPAPAPHDAPALAHLEALLADLAPHPQLAGHARRFRALGERLRRRLAPRPHPLPRGCLEAWRRPRGVPHDRVMSCFQALWEWGPGLATRLVRDAQDATAGEARLIGP